VAITAELLFQGVVESATATQMHLIMIELELIDSCTFKLGYNEMFKEFLFQKTISNKLKKITQRIF